MTVNRFAALLLCAMMFLTAFPSAALPEGGADEKGGTRSHESYFNSSYTDTYFTFTDSNTPWVDKTETNSVGGTSYFIESGNKGVNSSRSTVSSDPVQMTAGEKVSFNYWYRSEANHDYFRFYANGSMVFEKSGNAGYWISYTYTVPSDGVYTFKWEYVKDASGSYSDDCARLSQFSFSRCANLYRERAVLAPGGGGLTLNDAPPDGIYKFDVSQDTGEHKFYLASSNWHIANTTARVEASCRIPSSPAQTHYIAFDYKVESEAGCDCFFFKIDGSLIMVRDGEGDYNWKHYRYALTPGYHVFTWEYVKDSDTDSGHDRACIDNITLENYDGAQDRYNHFVNNLHPDNTMPLIFNTPNGTQGFTGTVIGLTNNNRYIDASTSFFETEITMRSGETFSFSYLVSSESYDRLKFYVDGSLKVSEGGWENPQVKTYSFTASSVKTYKFRWEYVKDGSISRGYDTAFIINLKYDGSFNDFDSDDIDAIINDPLTDEYLHFIGGAGLCGWFQPYYTNSWNAVKSTNRYYENTESAFSTTCYMNVGDKLSFEFLVDSEDGADYLDFEASRRTGSYYEEEDSLSLSGSYSWDTYTFTCEKAGDYMFSWSYEKDYSVNTGGDCAMVDNVCVTRMNELDRALNPDGTAQSEWLHFDSTGEYVFVPADFNGRYCARSGNTGHGSTTASVTTSVMLSANTRIGFDYYINSERTYDYLVFLVNGVEIARFSGQDSTAWQTFTTDELSGRTELEWRYVKDGNLSYGTDTAAIDNVRIVSGLMGDVNFDGVVNTEDALLTLRAALGLISFTASQTAVADVTGDGAIATDDALFILRYALELIHSF